MKVAVVGAGAAGLAATNALRKSGVDVTCFEETPYAGGRARCYSREGFIMDVGAQFTAKICATQNRLCREFGLEDEQFEFGLETGFWRNGKIYPLPPDNPLGFIRNIDRLFRFRGLPLKVYPQMAKVLFQMLKRFINIDYSTLNAESLLDLGDTSVTEFTLKYGGREALDWAMGTLCGTFTIGEPDDISIAHLIGLMGLYEGLLLMERGIGSLPEAIFQRNRDAIRLSTPVTEVVIEDGKVKGVKSADGFMDADHVICATTASVARNIMPDLPDSIGRALEKVRYSSTVHLALGMEERVLPGNLYAVAIPKAANSFSPGLNDASNKSDKFAPPGAGLSHFVTYGTRAPELMTMPDEEVVNVCLAEIARLGGNVRTKPVVADVIRWPEAICLEPPGQFPAMYCMKRNAKGDVKGLHLAGEYMYVVSCVEGAMRSGEDAATEVIAQG